MSQPCESFQKDQIQNRPQPRNQTMQNQQIMTDERIKEIIIESLIELNLVPKPKKKKVLSTV